MSARGEGMKNRGGSLEISVKRRIPNSERHYLFFLQGPDYRPSSCFSLPLPLFCYHIHHAASAKGPHKAFAAHTLVILAAHSQNSKNSQTQTKPGFLPRPRSCRDGQEGV